MAEIRLRQQQAIQIDDADLASVRTHTWCVQNGKDGKQYVFTTIEDEPGEKRRLYLPRFLMNPEAGFVVRHLDGNPLNNRRSNLEVRKHSQEKHTGDADRKTGGRFRGVRYIPRGKRHWAASITHNREYRHLGVFETELEAAEARDAAALDLWGEYAVLNLPDAAHKSS